MATIFWDMDGVIMIDYLPLKSTITGQYYATLLQKLRSTIKEKRHGKLSKGILLLHDNAPAVLVSAVSATSCNYPIHHIHLTCHLVTFTCLDI